MKSSKKEKREKPKKHIHLAKKRNGRSAKSALLTGTFRASDRGYGFVTPADENTNSVDIFIKSDNTGGALDRDRVRLRILKQTDKARPDKGREGEIVEILERGTDSFIGTLFRIKEARAGKAGKKEYWCVIPDSSKLKLEPRVIPPADAREGYKVEAVIKSYGDARHPATAEITRVFGDSLSREANYAAILYEYGIEEGFSEETEKQAQAEADQPLSAEGRTDLREKLIFTIDGADAKDLDDAISIDVLPDGGWVLGVHIADVSHYVREYTSVDNEALRRGTSVYFADKAIPMLPKSLSNGACSLNGGEDKYTLSAMITIAPDGSSKGCELKEALIRSSVRGVYSEINDLLNSGNNSRFFEKYEIVYPALLEMSKVYNILDSRSKARGALELDSADAKVLLGPDGMPVDIIKRERGVSERIIEQFMLCANEAVATWLHTRRLPCVYRIHENPSPEKIQAFSLFAHNLGLDITPIRQKKLSSSSFRPLLEQAEKEQVGAVVSRVLLRSLMKAKYSQIQSSHFGLALDFYCHFTSPIRRYPDLSVHRIVKYVLHGNSEKDTLARYSAFAALSAKTSTENELRAVSAERAVEDLYKVMYMSAHVGETFDATISSVTSFGMFAELDNTCEGLILISTMNGYFTFDEKALTLTSGSMVYRLGDRIRVRIENANIIRRRIEMSIV